MASQAGVFVEQAPSDGHWFMGFAFADGDVMVKIGLATAENVDQVVNEIVTGLRTAKGELKQKASGLITVQEIPDGLHKPSSVRSTPGRTTPRK